jgi:hypothetical protein
MIREKDIVTARGLIHDNLPGVKACIFGSSLREETFGDVDIALFGDVAIDDVLLLKDVFFESDFPRPVDIIRFETADETFKKYVLEEEVKEWI